MKFFFRGGVYFYCPSFWSAVAQSCLNWAQVILSSSGDFSHVPPCPANLIFFCRDGVLLCCPHWSQVIFLPKCWDYSCELLYQALTIFNCGSTHTSSQIILSKLTLVSSITGYYLQFSSEKIFHCFFFVTDDH